MVLASTSAVHKKAPLYRLLAAIHRFPISDEAFREPGKLHAAVMNTRSFRISGLDRISPLCSHLLQMSITPYVQYVAPFENSTELRQCWSTSLADAESSIFSSSHNVYCSSVISVVCSVKISIYRRSLWSLNAVANQTFFWGPRRVVVRFVHFDHTIRLADLQTPAMVSARRRR